ncbi:MAG TPA: hypothetical protein VNN07_15840 [Candidatus Tectomicrobia bacterium]|nr:hypothetical protein [Candidatus Tectomicrobia bacterium]
MEEQAKPQEATRRAQEMGRRAQERARESGAETARMAGQLAGLGTETLGVWTDLTQHTMRGLMDLSVQATQEQTRQWAEMQQTAFDMWREMQATAFRWQTAWPEAFRDPFRWYQRSLEEGVDSTQRLCGLARRNAEAMTQTFQRLESATQDATRMLQDTFKDAATRMQDVSARTDRVRAA